MVFSTASLKRPRNKLFLELRTPKTVMKAYGGIYSLQTPIQQFLSHTNWATGYAAEVGNKDLFGFLEYRILSLRMKDY